MTAALSAVTLGPPQSLLGSSRALPYISRPYGQVAQLVEQRTENPRVGGSIPSLAIHSKRPPDFTSGIPISVSSSSHLDLSLSQASSRQTP